MQNMGFAKLFFAIGCFLSACSTASTVLTYNDPAQSFEQYRTFAWVSDKPMLVSGKREPNQLITMVLQDSIVDALTKKGFTYMQNSDNADMVVFFTVGTREDFQVQQDQTKEYFGSHWRWGHENFNLDSTSNFPTHRQYTEGSLSIDIFDVKRKSPIWHGGATKELTPAELRGDSMDSTKEAVESILASFPPLG